MAPLLERDQDLARIRATLAHACEREGALLSVEGRAGTGKSTLLEAAAENAADAGFRVLRATGRELERGFAFGVVVQLFSPLLESLEQSERAELFVGAASLAEPLFYEGGERAEPPGEQFPLLHGLHWLTANLAALEPLLLVVDDAQWADDSSLAALSYLAPRAGELPLCLAVAIRSGESTQGDELAQAFAREGATIVRPAALSDRAVRELLGEEREPGEIARLAAECARVTGGNPLFVRELIRSLDAAEVDDPEQVATIAPDSVVQMVLDRVARLADGEAAVARAIALLGDDPDPGLIAELSDTTPQQTAAAIDRLADLGLLVLSPRLGFEHPIVRQAVYEAIPEARRAQDHLRAARAMAADLSLSERVSVHLLAADPAVQAAGPEAVEALRHAAGRARKQGATELSARFIARALQERLDPDLRRELLLALGSAEVSLGAPAGVERLRQAEELSATPAARAEAALALAAAQAQTGDLIAATETCERGLAAEPPERESRLALEAQRANARWLAGTMSRKDREHLDELARDADAGATPAERSVLTIFAGEAGVSARLPAEEVNRLADSALADGRLLDEVGAEHPVYIAAGAAKSLSENLDAAIGEWTRGIEHSRRRGSPHGYASALFSRAYIRYLAGDLAGAEADAAEAFDLLPVSELITAPLALATAANVAAERGGLAEPIERALEEMTGHEGSPAIGTINYATLASGRLAVSRGSVQRGLERFLRAGKSAEAIGWTGCASLPWRSCAALAMVELDRGEEAVALAEDEVRVARSYGAPGPLGIALHAAGAATGGEAGIELLRESVATLAGSDSALEHAKALTALGSALRESGAEKESRRPLREGMDLAHRCGATLLVGLAMAELHASGARPRRPALRGAQALSPQERQTTRLAADGLSNREIAEAMFLTRRTVEMHLTSAYRKLGIGGREELAQALTSQD